MPRGSKTPRWSLDSVYPGYDSPEYQKDLKALKSTTSSALKTLRDTGAKKASPGPWLAGILKKVDRAYRLYLNLESYVYCCYAVDTRDSQTVAQLNALEAAALPLKQVEVELRNGLADLKKKLPQLKKKDKTLSTFCFYLDEQLEFQSHQMSVEEENLASDLSRSGGDAWGRLQETVSSNLTAGWTETETKTVVELRSMAMDKDRSVRKKAYETELAAWQTMEDVLAASLNGVKGFCVTLDTRRNYESSLDKAALLSRISGKTLKSLIGVMEKNLPVFRRYLKAKARLLGVDRCAFYDLFAPVGDSERTWTFGEAQKFIVRQFETFSPDLKDLASTAFNQGWIDAETRKGKVPGAFCTFMPLAKESRILANFDGSFDSVATLAHELGHAYHGSVLKNEPGLHQEYPMTLAETASIFCETIVFNRAIAQSRSDSEKIGILELFLQGATAVIVDILSRFKFETSVFERRKERELSPDEFCDLMLKAQKATYGSGLDAKQLHPYMWAVKGHYYSVDLPFYNYPYAFGELLGLALYGNYETEPDGFPERYRELLKATGRASAEEVTARAGFDIETEAFWQTGMDIIKRRVRQFEQLVETARS